MTARTSQKRRSSTGDPLNDLLDDTDMKRAAARVRPRLPRSSLGLGTGVWWIAAAASFVWVMSVFAYSWSRYALPSDPGSVLDAAKTRIETSDWMTIIAAILGPLLLIWTIAWLVRRSMELKDESRRLARAAILLADAAEAAEMRAEKFLPSGRDGDLQRATNAMNSLQTKMGAMEQALVRQAAAFDNAAERAEARAAALRGGGTLSAGQSFAALPGRDTRASNRLSMRDDAAPDANKKADAQHRGSPSPEESADPGLVVTEKAMPARPKQNEAVTVDLALDQKPQLSRAETLRAELKTAAGKAPWTKLVPAGDRGAAISAKPAVSPPESSSARKTASDMSRLDPFEDLDPTLKSPALGGAGASSVTTAAALEVGATRDEFDVPPVDARLGKPSSSPHPMSSEPSITPPPLTSAPSMGVAANTTPINKSDFDFVRSPLDWQKFVRAANFPESERDTETLDALYDVLTDPEAAALLQSSEDTLATLSDLDLYMEDFVPEMSPVITWRAHLDGKIGDDGITPIDAPIELSRVNAKLEADPDFGKLIERFCERYQGMLRRLLKEAGEDRLALDLADSRTGRAYVLVAGALGKL